MVRRNTLEGLKNSLSTHNTQDKGLPILKIKETNVGGGVIKSGTVGVTKKPEALGSGLSSQRENRGEHSPTEGLFGANVTYVTHFVLI